MPSKACGSRGKRSRPPLTMYSSVPASGSGCFSNVSVVKVAVMMCPYSMHVGQSTSGQLDPFFLCDCSLAAHVAGVDCALRLEQQNVRLVLGHGHVLDAARHDEEVTFVQ